MSIPSNNDNADKELYVQLHEKFLHLNDLGMPTTAILHELKVNSSFLHKLRNYSGITNNAMRIRHQQLDELEHRLLIFTLNHFERIGNKLEYLSQRLHTNSLPAALKRGFSFLCDNQGNLIRSIEKLPPGKKLRAHLEDGSRPLEVIEEESD